MCLDLEDGCAWAVFVMAKKKKRTRQLTCKLGLDIWCRVFQNLSHLGAVHKLCNAEDGRGGHHKMLHGGRGVKNGPFWRYIIYGQPLIQGLLLHFTSTSSRWGTKRLPELSLRRMIKNVQKEPFCL